MPSPRRPSSHTDPELPPLGAVLDFMRLLWAVNHGLNRVSKRMDLALGVTGPQRLALRFIGRFPGLSAGRLAAILYMHPSTLTGILRRLQLRGFVSRRADPRDQRRSRLGLTDKGRARDAGTRGTVEEIVDEVLAGCAPAELAAASAVLARLAAALAPTHAAAAD